MPKKNKSITRSDTFDKDFAELEEISERASKSDMPNEKIKEIIEKVLAEAYKEFLPNTWYFPSNALNFLKKSIQEYSQFVRQKTLDEAIKCVPETMKPYNDEDNCDELYCDGWLHCRKQTLSNLQALKDNK